MSSLISGGFLLYFSLIMLYLTTIFGWPALVVLVLTLIGTTSAMLETQRILPRIMSIGSRRSTKRRLH